MINVKVVIFKGTGKTLTAIFPILNYSLQWFLSTLSYSLYDGLILIVSYCLL